MKQRARTAGVLVLALSMAGALTACGESSDTSADPSPTTATSSAPSPATEDTTARTPDPSAALVLGPDGFGALTLGMTRDQAEATGIAEPVVDYPYGGCALSQLVGAPGDATHPEPGPGSGIVYVSSTLGVAAIEAYAGIETPEGIGIGSPMSAVITAYPDWDPPSEYLMRGYAPVPGNDELQYRIAFDDARTVSGVTLQLVDQDCYE